jgi:hypothetical protein
MPKTSRGRKQTPATLRSTSGAGFEFEDLISAWLLVKMLSGEPAPAIGGIGTQVQAQVSTLGWHIDDLLLTTQGSVEVSGRLAVSAKGNLQVTASGLPADFVKRAWKQWRDAQSPFNKLSDGLALVTLGTNRVFDPTWREVKNACFGSDPKLALSRIRSNPNQSKVFNSVKNPDQKGSSASDEETIELIRRLHVLPVDLQLAYSETKNQAIAQCRRVITSGDLTEAENLWQRLVNEAMEVRLRQGTLTLQDLWSKLRKKFNLRQHADFERDWEMLSSITSDYKARIETELPSGYSVPRAEEKSKLEAEISTSTATVLFGESGSGKSALVKNVLDTQLGGWTQVWFGPDELMTALSAARRGTLPLGHELTQVLSATANPNNVLVIDSAERIDPGEFVVIRQLIEAVLAPTEKADDRAWRVVIITQPQGEGALAILGGRQIGRMELEPLRNSEVKLALSALSSLSWLTGQDETVAVLTNLKTLAWAVKAGTALGSNATSLASHAAIADSLWSYWTGDRPDVQALMMRLAKREAEFERSFPLTTLDPVDTVTFTQRPDRLPLRLNQRTRRVEFEHDLAADWARFQFLKQSWTDTSQWTVFAENPLWTNSLRILGQFLLRQQITHGTAWDAAFKTVSCAQLHMAGNILLDALCMDPEAERLLTERADLLLADDAKHLSNLLIRFHHIATVPAGKVSDPSWLNLYMEAQYRSPVIARWPPVLRFLISQRERLSGWVSSAFAKVIQTWLTGTPYKLGNGAPVPFRRELAEIAVSMARTVQVQKGQGVIYASHEPLLYTTPLAGAADLPEEVGAWALELAGRRSTDDSVSARIIEFRRQEADRHQERLQVDPAYKERHEARHRIPPSIGSIRERLPPWPLGANRRVDGDFRTACFKDAGLQPLMRTRPEVAAEVLLALIIEDEPERAYGSRLQEAMGLEYAQESYPTAFWKSPFFPFLQIDPHAALKALIALVNFCTERWVAEIMEGREGSAPGLRIQMTDDGWKTFSGGQSVFDWTQTNSHHGGNLFSALDALERWLTLQVDASIDIAPYAAQILKEGTSAALIGLLINVGKYRPPLFSGALAPLLMDYRVFPWDNARVSHINFKFDALNWSRAGETVFNIARDWTLAPHRQRMLQDVVVELLKVDPVVAARLHALIPNWHLPEDPKESLESRLLFAMLDRENYRLTTDPATGTELLAFICPNDLRSEVELWQENSEKPLQYLLLPRHCEKLLEARQAVGDGDAVSLFNLMKDREADDAVDESTLLSCRLALATTLIVLADDWLDRTPDAKGSALASVRAVVGEVATTAEEIRSQVWNSRDELKFAAYAVMHLWMKNDDQASGWENSVLRLLTSGDSQAAGTVVGIAYANRHRLGPAWWRVLQAGVLWAGLSPLAPHPGDDEGTERAWDLWLARLRRFPLRTKDATADDLDMSRVAEACARLDYYRRMRIFKSGIKGWHGEPDKEAGNGLDWHFLGVLFHWLINGAGTGNWAEDTKLVKKLWDYEAKRAKERAKEDSGKYDLPSQDFGYDLLWKLAELSIAAPEAEARSLWEPVLAHGPEAHYALQHFIQGIFVRLSNGDNPAACECIWRAMAEYGLTAKWEERRLWYYGERLLCDLLGFGNENALLRLTPGAALRMRDVYERWAERHLAHDEECVSRFCYFLTKDFGAALRLDGLRWIASTLKASGPSSRWHRSGTDDALVELINTSLNQNPQDLVKDSPARQALVEIAALLAAQNLPTALALQERIKLLR